MVYVEVHAQGTDDMADYYMFADLLDATSFLIMMKATQYVVTDHPMYDDDRYTLIAAKEKV